MPDPITLTLAQLNPIVGDLEHNAQRILDTWANHKDKSDLMVFPELFLCGYPPEDLVLNHAFIKAIKRKISDIQSQTREYAAAAIIPTPWIEENKLYNAALLIENGKIKNIIKKSKLPNNYVFDEKRTFHANKSPKITEFKGHKLGIMICEDIWHADIAQRLTEQGAESLIVINASPYHSEQQETRDKIIKQRVSETSLDIIYLNMVGGQDELVFDGASFIANKNQKIIYKAPSFKEAITSISIPELKTSSKTVAQINKQEELYKAAQLGLRDYVTKNGFKDVIIGLSGGIDSALTAAIAVDALGSNHVRCVMLPSEFTSKESLEDAEQCAQKLGVSYENIEIKQVLKSFETLIPNLSGLAHENTQSRIRGTILMALSNASGAILLTTGNKSEMAVGYCTLYGDMNGGFNPLKDVYKTEVYALCEWRNTVSYVIPDRIINKEPSAELRADQKDQDSLPPYDLLDDILFLLIEGDNINWAKASPELLKIREKCLKHPDEIKKVAKLLGITNYKRHQAPPGPRLTYKGFGRDRRYPLTNGFTNTIEKD